jgi:hypothetical protein
MRRAGVYRTFRRGIAFGRAYKERREIGAKHDFAYSETNFDNLTPSNWRPWLSLGFTRAHFLNGPNNSNYNYIFNSPPQVQAIIDSNAPKELTSPLFSPNVATALSSPLSTRESVPFEIPAGSHAQQRYRYHHDGFLIGPTVIQNRDFSLRWSE